MKKKIAFAVGVVIILLGLYFILAPKEQVTKKQNVQSAFLGEYLKSDWLNTLPEQEWGEIKKDADTYAYEYKEDVSDDSKIGKSVEYKKTEDGEFQGTMKIDFSGKADSYVVNVPKSFASHVDEINFSTEPSKVINPDPIVEFSKSDSKIEIESKEKKKIEEVEDGMVEQIFETESKRCDALEGDEAVACGLSLVAKYRDSKELKDEISKLDMTQVSGASVVAVSNGNMRACKYVKDYNEKTRCLEYVYQILVQECHSSSGKEYRNCVRDLSSELPTLKEQRLFCGHIDDEAMRKECQGVASISVCDEIENEEQKNTCQLNIARTKNNPEDCKKITNKDYQQACIALIGISKEDESYCDKLEDEYMRGQCRAKIAMIKNDKNICSKIKDQDSRDICNGYFIFVKGEATEDMCKNTNELFLKEMCEMVLAMNNKDVEACMDQTIVSYENQAICLAGIGVKHGDSDVCGKINIARGADEFEEGTSAGEKMRDICYAGAAKKNGDKSLCKKIADSKLKKDCLGNKSKEEKEEIKEVAVAVEEEDVPDFVPALPDWMDCPVPEGAKMHTFTNDIGSVLKYSDPNDDSKLVGPNIRYNKPNFEGAHLIFCYNADGKKHGQFKEIDKKTGDMRREGYYKNGEWDQLIIAYSSGLVRSKVMYSEGLMNGAGEDYCINDGCGKGTLAAKGQYVDGKKQGTWQYYKNGLPTQANTYNKGYAVSKTKN